MRQMRTVGIAAVAIIGAIAYGELVYDWRTFRSSQSISHAITVNHSLSLVSYNKHAAAMVQKYGQQVKAGNR